LADAPISTLVVLRVAAWLPRESLLTLAVTVTGIIGLAGNVAYGFDTIHMSLGDTALVHQSGAANLIKPYGLLFPLSLALMAWGLGRLGHQGQAALIAVAAIAWPVAHIGNTPGSPQRSMSPSSWASAASCGRPMPPAIQPEDPPRERTDP
jgi:hypothetical protein